MKKTLLLLPALFIMSCGSKTESNSDKISQIKTDTSNNLQEKKEVAKTNFEKYSKEGILLIGSIKFFDENFKEIGKLEIDEISKVQISEKSITLFNIDKSKDYCLKSNFLKIGYKQKEYILFGQDVYEINKAEKIDFQNEKNKAFSIFPITNFEMGASDDNGLTGCDDFSYLILLDKKNEKYSTITAPKNQENNSTIKFANLVHDDGSFEKIYNVKVINDSLILGIKVSYQEGYGSYNLKSSFKDNLENSIIANQNRFDEETKYKELK
ncbi:hypothetical protein FNW52_03730 [Flavobacterium sp. ZT3R18]|uniref:hypothetical protein n=1 Tax=Flavobacterium sp. ZT3R18 TaxID=2594429 RepID=UPI00117BD555|nr:hypothetical protein [Flavobacterium sp. ZT3R18]TRX38022.1 hypothetical protein FNW52_03730 [Flavobacterium sp. ZT3R18]